MIFLILKKFNKITDEERIKNSNKGCVNPADGTPKKSIINVVNWVSGDVTRRIENNPESYINNIIKYFENNKYELIFICIIIGLFIIKYNKRIRKFFKI